MKKHIALCGMMGSGKSTIGLLLSKRLDRLFLDSDKKIETLEKKTIREIFDNQGEAYFRAKESETILELLNNQTPAVISLGGGSLMDPRTLKVVNSQSILIYLKVSEEIITHRIGSDRMRPLLKGHSLADLFLARKAGYESADLVIENDHFSAETAVEGILEAIATLGLRAN